VRDDDLLAGPVERQAKVWPLVVVQLFTSDGIEGLGLGLSIGGGFIKRLAAATQELAQLTIGEEASRVETIHAKLSRHASSLGGTGLFLAALPAIDCALWDIKGKDFGLPLWKLLGRYRNRIPTYASGALHRGVPIADLPAAAEREAAHGFRHIKMHLALNGDYSPNKELARAKLVREVLGPDIHLTIDVNERWSVAQAINMGSRLEEVGLYWIEDPTRWGTISQGWLRYRPRFRRRQWRAKAVGE
jgi:L-talarate/galactarate dehydratase